MIFFFATLFSPTLQITYCHNSFECSLSEECKSGICVNACNGKFCGENAECEASNHQAACVCIENFIGMPLEKCWKIGENPCEPNPCGKFSICVKDGGRSGPYCLCEKGYFVRPPKCREGCANDSQCKLDESCIDHECKNPCEKNPCGENSVCRSENHSKAICSCVDGFFPQFGYGCRALEKKDLKIDLKNIERILRNVKCGKNALMTSGGSCMCSLGFDGDPKVECKVEKNLKNSDKCSPFPCGPFANCTTFENRANCSCVKGFLNNPPNCSPCLSSSECPSSHLCVNQKCIKNPCEDFCGKSAECQIVNEKVEFSCAKAFGSNPFIECPSGSFGDLWSCDKNATTPKCGVPIKEITKTILASG